MSEIAVIIPVHIPQDMGNVAVQWLNEAMSSVVSQSFTDWEMIVVVDGGLKVQLSTESRIKTIYLDSQSGPGAARNVGAKSTSAPWLVFLDADDKLAPNSLRDMYAARCENGVIYGDLEWMGDTQGYHRLHDWSAERLRELDGLLPVTALHSRSAWEKVGGFDEHLRGLEDVEYFIRLAEQGICGQRLNLVTMQYRKHGQSRTAGLERDKQGLMGAISREIKDKHRAFFGGDMARCSTCPGSTPEVTPMQGAAPSGAIEFKYTGGRLGSYYLPSSPETGNQYRIEGRGDHVFVDPRDAQWVAMLMGPNGPDFVRVDRLPAPPAAVSPALFESPSTVGNDVDLSTMNVKEIRQLVTDTAFAPDLRVWLAIEKASDDPRKSVIEVIEKRISALLDGEAA